MIKIEAKNKYKNMSKRTKEKKKISKRKVLHD